MEKANYHTHTTGSDGELSPIDLIKLAIKKKFKILGITDHYHFPPGFRDWGNGYYSDEHYKELNRLKEKYKDKIKIFVNVEFDWLGEDYKKYMENETKKKYDYKFVSVHFLKIGEEYFPINHSQELFEEMLKKIGGTEKLVKLYYSELRKAIKTGWYDVIAHFDLIKIWNKDKKYFSGEESWYKEEVHKTLELIKKQGMRIELNTSGWRMPCAEQYPSLEILKEAEKMKIPILIGTDAHRTEGLESGLKEAEKLLEN